jgi:hypothetical protein
MVFLFLIFHFVPGRLWSTHRRALYVSSCIWRGHPDILGVLKCRYRHAPVEICWVDAFWLSTKECRQNWTSASRRSQNCLSTVRSLNDFAPVVPATTVWDLNIFVVSDLTMDAQFRRHHASILWLDFDNGVLIVLLACLNKWLQSVKHSVLGIKVRLDRFEHTFLAFVSLRSLIE